ncbi:MAG: hypothetical protein GX066_04815 [Clostridiaceae bacterium]|nr:hypothetical protein [Clostridiaceae bacterium]
MKHALCTTILIIMVITFSLGTAFAQENHVVMKVNGATVKAGDTVKVDVILSENSNVCAGTFNITYDNTKLELISCDAGSIIENATPLVNQNYRPDTVRMGFMTLDPIKSGGVLCSISFIAIGNEGTADIQVKEVDFVDFDAKNIPVTVENGAVKIDKSTGQQGGHGGSTGDSNDAGDRGNNGDKQETPPEPADTVDILMFNDLSGYDWAKDEINYLAQKGIIRGTSNTTFSPQLNIKRADFIVLLVRMLGLTSNVDDNFSDVQPDKYYYNEIGIAKKLGLISGIGNNKFNPEESITRQDMFVIAYRVIKDKGLFEDGIDIQVLNKFDDRDLIADYAKTALATFVEHELVKGSDNRINPNQYTTRAETAVFIYRLYEYLKI